MPTDETSVHLLNDWRFHRRQPQQPPEAPARTQHELMVRGDALSLEQTRQNKRCGALCDTLMVASIRPDLPDVLEGSLALRCDLSTMTSHCSV